MEQKRVTQSDVAKAAGVTRPVVSLAFKNHPSIPRVTRERILRLAEKLGYHPDPMLSALAAYRLRMRPPTYQGTLAWLTLGGTADRVSMEQGRATAFRAATEQAARHGYKLEPFALGPGGLSAERLSRVLVARNTRGILLCPAAETAALNFAWERFSVVALGCALRRPALHTVAAAHYRASLEAVSELRARGYRRIGFAVSQPQDRSVEHQYLAGYLVGRQLFGDEDSIPPLAAEDYSRAPLSRWLQAYEPDAIVSGDPAILRTLASLGLRAPEDIGVLCPGLAGTEGDVSGWSENPGALGRVAADLVVRMIHQGERGVPALPQRLHVECRWVEGRSLRPKHAPASPWACADEEPAGTACAAPRGSL